MLLHTNLDLLPHGLEKLRAKYDKPNKKLPTILRTKILVMLASASRKLASMSRGVLGPLQTNCYLIKMDNHCLIVDPAAEHNVILNWIKQNAPNAKTDIFLTHGHFDHISAVPGICDQYPKTRIFASKKDLDFLKDSSLNLSTGMGLNVDLNGYLDRIEWLKEGDSIEYGEQKFNVLEIPGHSPGSLGLVNKTENCVFVGDTLFAGSVGNTELPRSNFVTMMKSIVDKLLGLPNEMVVLSGHGEPTTIGEEKKSNPFVIAELAKIKAKKE